MARSNSRARMFHTIADELGCAPELVGAVAVELKLKKRVDVVEAVKARLSSASANETTGDEAGEKQAKPKKASLTLSQRRALLRLQDETAVVPGSPFKALPYIHLIEVGLAVASEDGIVLTADGVERAASINPGYRVWAQGESVVEGGTINASGDRRPPAGTKRSQVDPATGVEVATA